MKLEDIVFQNPARSPAIVHQGLFRSVTLSSAVLRFPRSFTRFHGLVSDRDNRGEIFDCQKFCHVHDDLNDSTKFPQDHHDSVTRPPTLLTILSNCGNRGERGLV